MKGKISGGIKGFSSLINLVKSFVYCRPCFIKKLFISFGSWLAGWLDVCVCVCVCVYVRISPLLPRFQVIEIRLFPVHVFAGEEFESKCPKTKADLFLRIFEPIPGTLKRFEPL